MEGIQSYRRNQEQICNLCFYLKRCDARKQPFLVFCQALELSGHVFISNQLKLSLDKINMAAAEVTQAPAPVHAQDHDHQDACVEKCTFCLLVENLCPAEIALPLYQDSSLSSDEMEEIILNPERTRKEGVKFVLKRLVNYQREKGTGREYIDALVESLPENQQYLVPYVRQASLKDLTKCSCAHRKVDQKVKPRSNGKVRNGYLPTSVVASTPNGVLTKTPSPLTNAEIRQRLRRARAARVRTPVGALPVSLPLPRLSAYAVCGYIALLWPFVAILVTMLVLIFR